MPLGLKNALTSFQRAVSSILSRVRWKFDLVHLEDIIVYLKSVSDHLVHVRTALALIQSGGVTMKLSRGFFFDDTLSYLLHTVLSEKPAVDTKNCDAIRKSLSPTSQTDIQSVLEVCNVYQLFCFGFA